MNKPLFAGLLGAGFLIILLTFVFQDYLILSKQSFAISVATLRISNFALLFFTVLTLVSLGPRVVSRGLYTLGILLIPSLIPDLIHIFSFSFFPDFITENKRQKTAYLYLTSRTLVILALFLSVFWGRKLAEAKRLKLILSFLLALSVLSTAGIVLYYPSLPALFLYRDAVGTPWYVTAFNLISAGLLFFLASQAYKKNAFGTAVSPHLSLAIGFIGLSSFAFALSIQKHEYDIMLPLASLFRLMGYMTLSFSVLYLGVRKESMAIMESTRGMLSFLGNSELEKEGTMYYLKVDEKHLYCVRNIFFYDLENKAWVAQVYTDKRKDPPEIDISQILKILKTEGGSYSDGELHFSILDNYLLVTEISSEYDMYVESPIKGLHVMNLERLVYSFVFSKINFEKTIEEKVKEIQKLYLLLEASEYATQAFNKINTFSKHVLEKFDQVLKIDGSLFYIWNKNAELPDKMVFSSGFIDNFSGIKTYKLIERVMNSPNIYGAEENFIYCKFETDTYQSGVIGLRRSEGFSQEELLFSKTISNQLFYVIKLMKVIEDLENAQANIKLLSDYDQLTMLYNRKNFEKILKEEIEMHARSGEPMCLLFLDVDNFKVINDTYGFHVGDMVLRQIAELMRRRIRKLDTACRLGSDQFCILLPKANKSVAETIAERLRQEISSTPITAGGAEIRISLSVGVVCYPIDSEKAEELLSLGESLVHYIKKEGKGKVRLVDESIKDAYAFYRKVEKDILESLEKRSIEVFFQDIMSLKTGKIEGFEALMRLRVQGDLLPAGRFIHIAENLGLTQRLDTVMIEKVFGRISTFGDSSPFVFINLSPSDLTEVFLEEAVSIGKSLGIKNEKIVFEITEREAIQDIGKMSNFINNMKEAGFKFAIDDFGSGYASFLYLKYLPVDFLKIEGEFIKSMTKARADLIFVKSMVEIARGLGIKTVAEFVEDRQTLEILYEMGVDYAQGYYIGKPGPMEDKLRSLSSTK